MGMTIRPYRPSNGTEGMIFMEEWCDTCAKENGDRHCSILGKSMFLFTTDKGYPKELIYNHDGSPVCLAHRTTWAKTGTEPSEAGPLLSRMGEPE
jgi:hypothetical protein